MRTSQAMVAVFAQEVGMPASRLALLRLLAIIHPSPAGVVALARELGVDGAAVTRSIKQLEADRLVTVRADPADGRRKRVTLTANGLRTFERLHDRGHQLEESLAGDVSQADVATAVRVLGRLRGAIESVRRRPLARPRREP